MLRVVATDWQSSKAHLQCFQRMHDQALWQETGPAVPVSLGRNGLAWGRGLHPESIQSGRQKQEGDGCSPAGIFRLSGLFGALSPGSQGAKRLGMPYFQTSDNLKAIDDPASRYYNQIVKETLCEVIDWNSHEEMRRPDHRYDMGAIIAHNVSPCVPGAGSCIFLHIWEAPGIPTAGCTAGSPEHIRTICEWLDARASPVLVQLTESEYLTRRADWQLPEMRCT